jgi:hypothetical protein
MVGEVIRENLIVNNFDKQVDGVVFVLMFCFDRCCYY